MTFRLTFSFHRDYSLLAGSILPVEFESSKQRRTAALTRFFYVRNMASFMGGPCGRAKALPVPLPGLSTHTVPLTPFESGEAEIINRLQRSLT